MKKTFLLITILALVALPLFTFATSKEPNSHIWDPNILKGPLVVCSGGPVNGDGSPNNDACQDLCDLISQILNIVYFIIGVVIWIIIPIDVAVGGIMYMLAGANPGMLTKAKSILLGAVWAIAITLCSYVIVATFVNVMKIGGVGGFDKDACTITNGT